MEFSLSYCEVLHFARSNVRRKYPVNDKTHSSTAGQRDIGLYDQSSLKVASKLIT